MKQFILSATTIALLFITLLTACTKKPEGNITVTTAAVTSITENSAMAGGTVTSTGFTIGECGVCYSESSSPTINDGCTKDHDGAGVFNSTINGLKSGTKYYVRAYAKTSSGIEYGNNEIFTTLSNITINVFASPTSGGTVSGAGAYQSGQNCTVTATANTGYSFSNWTENGTVVSSNESYSFTVSRDRNLQANFSPNTFTISVSAEPIGSGTVSGGGEYEYGKSCTVTASPFSNCTFLNWTENDEVVSSNKSYTFTVTDNRNLVANFTPNNTPHADTWLQYDDDDGNILIWGYTDGGTMEWAVKYPSNMLAPYAGMKITKIIIFIGLAGTYNVYFYSGETTPTTQIYSGYSILEEDGWWTINLHTPVNVTGQNLWIALSTTHEAGKYPAGATEGSNNPDARWINWGTHGWCDAYLSGWTNQDITWIIRAFVTDNDKGCEIELSPFVAPLHKCAPTKIHTSQGVGNYKRMTK